MAHKVAAIICAAGAGKRFGGKRNKPFVDVAGRAVFLRSVELFSDRDDVKQVLLAIPAEDQEIVTVKWGANLKFFNVKIYTGGEQRFDTVAKGLQLVKDDIDLVAVHDAVRCCVTKEWIDRVIAAASKTGAAILACPLVGTIKDVKDGTITGTVDRTGLYEAQTPQVFKAELLRKAYDNLKNLDKTKISDDAQLVEALGQTVSIVQTASSNLKITCPGDIAIAEAIIKSRPKAGPKGPVGPYIEAQW
ncbi:MAG: 2-C-methyl-D-erythritol 4-phosphate cytidylyltransferase [Planctomycetota bacterium]|jgi:2-C-methyl-D-erythritol 4-phosphate cytidylyltransferase